jgi:hypothetical protein
VEELARAYGRKIKCGGEYDIKIEKGEWRDQKTLLVRAREIIAFMPSLFIMNTRLNTIPSNTTIVKAAKYRGMEVPHSTQDRATPTRTASRRQLSEQAFLAPRSTPQFAAPAPDLMLH